MSPARRPVSLAMFGREAEEPALGWLCGRGHWVGAGGLEGFREVGNWMFDR